MKPSNPGLRLVPRVSTGESPQLNKLSKIEIDIAILVAEGKTNREIADPLKVTESIVKNHLKVIFDKLGVWKRLELAMFVIRHGEDLFKQKFAA